MTVYQKIDAALKSHENGKQYHERSLDSIASYIDWAWQFKKITEAEKDEVCDRICALYDEEIAILESQIRSMRNGTSKS